MIAVGMHWNSYRLLEVVRIPWSDDHGIPEIFVDEPRAGLVTTRQPRKMRAPVRVRPSANGFVDLLTADPMTRSGHPPAVLRVSREGAIVQRVKLRPPASNVVQWQILDYAVDLDGNLHLLEDVITGEERSTVLRKLTQDGTELWSRSGQPRGDRFDLSQLEGTFSQLLIGSGSVVYLPATRHRGLIARINPDNGDLEPYADWGEWTGEAFIGPDERIYFVRFVPEQAVRLWVCLGPEAGRETQVICEQSTFDLLAAPVGVDAEGRAYTVKDMGVGCIGRDGFLAWFEHIESVIVDSRANVVLSSNCGRVGVDKEVDILVWDMDGHLIDRIALALPPTEARRCSGWWRLLFRDNQDRLWVYGVGTEAQDGCIVVFTARGEVESVKEWSLDLSQRQFRLQPSPSWRVDPDGAIYLPVLGPTAFHLFKMVH